MLNQPTGRYSPNSYENSQFDRECAGAYRHIHSDWKIVQNPAGWVAYREDHHDTVLDPMPTLRRAKRAVLSCLKHRTELSA